MQDPSYPQQPTPQEPTPQEPTTQQYPSPPTQLYPPQSQAHQQQHPAQPPTHQAQYPTQPPSQPQPPYSPPQYSRPQYPQYVSPVEVTPDERTMAMLSYLLGLVLSWLGPLIIFLVKKDESKFIAFHAAQALLIHLASAVIIIPLYILGMIFCVPMLLIPIVGILALVAKIMAMLAANRGEWHELPLVGGLARSWAGI